MRIRGQEVVEEVKRQLWLAVPLCSVAVLQYSLQTISVMFVGHLGTLPLSGTSMATSFAAVTGFTLLVGSLPEPSQHFLCIKQAIVIKDEFHI